jgi:hypothetical protein
MYGSKTGRVIFMTAIIVGRLFKKIVNPILFSSFFIWGTAFAGCLSRPEIVTDHKVVAPVLVVSPKTPVIVAPSVPLVSPVSSSNSSDNRSGDDIAKLHQSTPHAISAAVTQNPNDNGLLRSQGNAMDAVNTHTKDSQAVVDVNTAQVTTSSGTHSTVDLHGDDLIHFKTDQTSTLGTASMLIQDVKKVVDNTICMGDTTQAKDMSHGSNGEVHLTSNENSSSHSDGHDVSSSNDHQPENQISYQVDQHKTETASTVTTTSNPDMGAVVEPGMSSNTVNTPTVENAPTVQTPEEIITPTIVNNTVTTPTVENTPTVQTPEITITPTTVNDIVTTPTVENTSVAAPVVPAPPVVVTPSADVTITTPVIVAPTITEPTISTPTVDESTPTVTTPIVTTPTVTIPVIEIPSISNGDEGNASANNTPVINNSNVANVSNVVTHTTPTTNNTLLITDTSKQNFNATLSNDNKGLIVIGQVVRLTGQVTEVDENGQQHQYIGDNVHLGSKYVAKDPNNSLADVQYFNGDVVNVLK